MIGEKPAAVTLLGIFAALTVFHVLMIAGELPTSIAWGGQAAGSPKTLRILEAVGLVVTLLFAGVVAAKAGFIGGRGVRKSARVGMWVVFGYFVLSVFGNLASSSGLERAIFAPVSVAVALLALRLALGKQTAA